MIFFQFLAGFRHLAQLCAAFGVLEELGKETELSEAADSLYTSTSSPASAAFGGVRRRSATLLNVVKKTEAVMSRSLLQPLFIHIALCQFCTSLILRVFPEFFSSIYDEIGTNLMPKFWPSFFVLSFMRQFI